MMSRGFALNIFSITVYVLNYIILYDNSNIYFNVIKIIKLILSDSRRK